MRKFILGIILIMLLSITGCNKDIKKENDTKNDDVIVNIGDETFKLKSKRVLKNIQYLENYVDFKTDAIGNMRTMSYMEGEEYLFEVRVMYDEKNSLEETKKKVNHEEKKKVINDIEYSYYDYKNSTDNIVHLYLYNYKNITYSIMFIFKNDLPEFEKTFMDNVKFL